MSLKCDLMFDLLSLFILVFFCSYFIGAALSEACVHSAVVVEHRTIFEIILITRNLDYRWRCVYVT